MKTTYLSSSTKTTLVKRSVNWSLYLSVQVSWTQLLWKKAFEYNWSRPHVKAMKGTQSTDLNNGLQVQGTSHEAKQRHSQLEMTGLVDVSADSWCNWEDRQHSRKQHQQPFLSLRDAGFGVWRQLDTDVRQHRDVAETRHLLHEYITQSASL